MDLDARAKARRAAALGLGIAASVAVTLASLEAVVRLAERFGAFSTPWELVEPDPELGWRLRADRGPFRWTDACGSAVVLAPPASAYLVRRPNAPGGTRALFLGDSFTHAYSVSTGQGYPDLIERRAAGRLEAWVAAVWGFGNLQEYRLLERVAAEVRPDVVFWQLSHNDVMNNVFVLEDATIYNNQLPRPYLDPASGEVHFANPGPALFDHSRLARRVFMASLGLDRLYRLRWLESLDRSLSRPPDDPEAAERKGLAVLAFVLRRAQAAHPEARFVGFSAEAEREEAFAEVFEAHGAGFVRGVTEALAAETAPTDCRPVDSHWNRHGHEVVARTLAAWIARHLPGRIATR